MPRKSCSSSLKKLDWAKATYRLVYADDSSCTGKRYPTIIASMPSGECFFLYAPLRPYDYEYVTKHASDTAVFDQASALCSLVLTDHRVSNEDLYGHLFDDQEFIPYVGVELHPVENHDYDLHGPGVRLFGRFSFERSKGQAFKKSIHLVGCALHSSRSLCIPSLRRGTRDCPIHLTPADVRGIAGFPFHPAMDQRYVPNVDDDFAELSYFDESPSSKSSTEGSSMSCSPKRKREEDEPCLPLKKRKLTRDELARLPTPPPVPVLPPLTPQGQYVPVREPVMLPLPQRV